MSPSSATEILEEEPILRLFPMGGGGGGHVMAEKHEKWAMGCRDMAFMSEEGGAEIKYIQIC